MNDQITYPDNDQANYAYDGAGNMISVSNSASVPYAAFSGYNALGQVGTIAYHNGVTTTITYNAATNRLNELSSTANGTLVQDFVYKYDYNANITSIGDNVGQNSRSFTCNWLNTTTGPYGSQIYNIDATGNVGNPDDSSKTLGIALQTSCNDRTLQRRRIPVLHARRSGPISN